MNIFQKQLMIGDKSLAELPDLDGKRYARKITPPARVSVEEFLSRPTPRAADRAVCARCGHPRKGHKIDAHDHPYTPCR